jgi:hypothetical protein
MEADGAVFRLRLLKLSMRGRANLDLLCERALYATRQQLIPSRQDSHERTALENVLALRIRWAIDTPPKEMLRLRMWGPRRWRLTGQPGPTRTASV